MILLTGRLTYAVGFPGRLGPNDDVAAAAAVRSG